MSRDRDSEGDRDGEVPKPPRLSRVSRVSRVSRGRGGPRDTQSHLFEELPDVTGAQSAARSPLGGRDSSTPAIAARQRLHGTHPTDEPEPLPPGHTGHRKRLRERFLRTGPDGLADYELLELVLFRAIPRRDTKDLAKHLIARFGSFAEVVNAPDHRLKEISGMGESAIVEFRLIQAATMRVARSALTRKPALSSWKELLDYLNIAQAFETREQFRVLFLDKKNVLIADEVQGRGTIDHTPVYVREVVKRALELASAAIILVHNHPSGDPTPSRADIEMTKMIVDAAKPLGITVHDHVIVGRHGHASLKSLRLM